MINSVSVDAAIKHFYPLFTKKPKGQGFGLAVCKRLMEAQNSTITFESEKTKAQHLAFNFQQHNNSCASIFL